MVEKRTQKSREIYVQEIDLPKAISRQAKTLSQGELGLDLDIDCTGSEKLLYSQVTGECLWGNLSKNWRGVLLTNPEEIDLQ